MKLVVWLVLLFVVAVVAAMTLGANDGLASFYWRGWRLDLSLNFFILALLGAFIGLSTSVRLTRWLIGLPARAKAWRTERREQALQSAQRQALLESFAARYTRAVKAARRAQDLAQDVTDRSGKAETQAINHLLAAISMHRLQDRAGRDEQARLAQACLDSNGQAVGCYSRKAEILWATGKYQEARTAVARGIMAGEQAVGRTKVEMESIRARKPDPRAEPIYRRQYLRLWEQLDTRLSSLEESLQTVRSMQDAMDDAAQE